MIRFLLLIAVTATLAAAQPKTVSIKVQDKPVLTILEQVADACDAHLVVRHGLADRLEAPVTLVASDVAWADLVTLIDRQYHITMTLDGKLLTAVDSEEAWKGKLILKHYDVRSMLRGLNMYPAPDLNIPTPGGTGSCLLAPIADNAPPEVAQIEDIIQRIITPGQWGHNGVSIQEYHREGTIVAMHTAEGHQQIEKLLHELERLSNRQLVIRIYPLPATTVGGPILSAEQWKTMNAGIQPIAAFTTFDQQQNHHFSGRQRMIIADGNVVQTAYDPIISLLSDGLSVEVQPGMTIGGVLATIRFSAGNAELAGTADITSSDGQRQLPIDLSTQQLDITNDTRLIPLDGAAFYAFGDRRYAVAFTVLDYVKAAPVGK